MKDEDVRTGGSGDVEVVECGDGVIVDRDRDRDRYERTI